MNVDAALAAVRQITDKKVRIGMILGSGLGPLAENVENATRIHYGQIPDFPVSTVMGHAGELILGTIESQNVAVMKGRVHYYEGYTMQQVGFPVRLLRALGAEILIVTNAIGGLRTDMAPGDIMIMSDHINYTGDNPLRGPNDEKQGPRFPPMSRAYPEDLRILARAAGEKLGTPLKEGVYLGLAGPSFETPAEIRFFTQIGSDALGMSTVPEVIVANHVGMRVLGLSCVTNVLHGGPSDDTHVEVLNTARDTGPRMLAIVKELLRTIE